MTKLEQLWRSGELPRGCTTWAELARRLGWSEGALKKQRKRIRDAKREEPPVDGSYQRTPSIEKNTFSIREVESPFDISKQNRSTGGHQHENRSDDFASEDPTETEVKTFTSGKWPHVEAFDREPPPLPSMPEGHRIRGVSTLVGADGETKQQWIKTSVIDQGRQDWLEAIRALGDELPRLNTSHVPEHSNIDLLSAYAVGDPHIGMLAWHEDAGENFDLRIAEQNLVAAIGNLVQLSPPSHQALLILIGDNVHSDGQANTTTRGTRVDVDGRTVEMMRVAVRTARRAIDLLLTKHHDVHVIVERGNHDELLSAMLALALSLLYENEPRVTVDVSPELFHWYRFGANLIGTHHGHNAKPMDLLGVMAVDCAAAWGETKHRDFYTGHLHHMMTKEVPGVIIETLPTLASSDAWHRGMGYRSQRSMYVDVLHREHGHINRHIVGIEQVRGA